MHHSDTGVERIARGMKSNRNSVQPHGALIVSVHTSDDLHQRALAGSVLPNKPVDFAPLKREIHVAKRRHSAEYLRDSG
jgi:hypothetical protein